MYTKITVQAAQVCHNCMHEFRIDYVVLPYHVPTIVKTYIFFQADNCPYNIVCRFLPCLVN